ncbi:MAG: hypothetical protein ACO38F_04225 [Burkholderiaceae bacterium]
MTWWALRPWPQPPESQALAQATWDSLAQWALGWTPDVYRLPQAVVLHVTPAARLWGGTLAWCEAMQTQLHGLGWWPQLGAGDTPWQAQARLLLAAVGCQSGAAQDRACHRMPAADALPLWALPCAALHGKAWQALGLRRWGQLRALPRGSVAKRWGEATVYALDQAYGMRAHGLVRLQQPAHFDQTLLWSDPVESWAQCAQPAQHLLSAMARWLQTRQLQAQACQWHAQYETRRNAPAAETVAVRMSQPSASAQAWWRLTQSHWQTRQTAAPLLGLRLEVTHTQAALAPSHDLWQGASAAGSQPLSLLLDRMQARWGTAAVRRLQSAPATLPEAAQHTLPWAADQSIPPPTLLAALGPTPSWLLRPPLRLWEQAHKPWYQGPLQLLLGPQRVEQVHWALANAGGNEDLEASVWLQRDYFVARSEHAGLLWVYRQRCANEAKQSRWYLHGWFA